MHKANIDHIIKQGTFQQMEEMREVLVEAISKLKEFSPTSYSEVEFDLHKIAHNGKLGEDLAKKWVSCMQNKDGTTGEHWTWDQVLQVQKDKKIGTDPGEVYAVLNMMYSDYYNPKFDTNVYVEMTKDWINDPDVQDYKTLKYYYYVVH